MAKDTELKRAVITEELVALTGDMVAAVILRQLLYWCVRVKDVDNYIEEEKARNPEVKIEKAHGWIYKSAAELLDETMLDVSRPTVHRRLSSLVEKGWLSKRKNPAHWDRTMQYRPDLLKIEHDLNELGYTLATIMGKDFPIVFSVFEHSTVHHERSTVHSEQSTVHHEQSNPHREQSSAHSEQTIPETTTETTPSETTSETTSSSPADDDPDLTQEQQKIISLLHAYSISEPTASSLARKKDVNIEDVRGWIADAKHKESKLENPQGYVVSKLREGEKPPGREDDPDKYINGEYAEYIEH